MTETEMMQRVVAILTQARETADRYDEDIDRDDLDADHELMGELIAEVLRVDGITAKDPSPQAVADAVMAAVQPRIGLLAGCFIAAYVTLAYEHDARGSAPSSVELLRDMALRWELDGEDEG
jgi:hypothetical protein